MDVAVATRSEAPVLDHGSAFAASACGAPSPGPPSARPSCTTVPSGAGVGALSTVKPHAALGTQSQHSSVNDLEPTLMFRELGSACLSHAEQPP